MKILHIGKYHPPFMGGIENFMTDLMKQQVVDGHQVSAIVHHHEKKHAFVKEIDADVNIYRVPCFGQLAYAPIAPSFGFHLNNVIKKEQPDVLHIHLPNLSAFWCLLLPSARNIPWVAHWHADVIGCVPDFKIKLLYPFYRLFESTLLNKAKKIIATSPVYLTSSQPLKNYLDKTVLIPLGLSEGDELCRHVRLKPHLQTSSIDNVDSENINLLMIGRLTYYKGHSLIIDAIYKLKQQGLSFCLHIVGGGELLPDINQQVERLQLNDNVKLLGKLSDKALTEQLNNTDLLCLPSIERTEAFGVVLLEAMRASKPCLVSDVFGSGMSWVVQDNKTGFVVKHNNVGSLVDKLEYISNNRKLLPQFGISGRKRFGEVFSIKAVSAEASQLYKDVVVDSETSPE